MLLDTLKISIQILLLLSLEVVTEQKGNMEEGC